VSTLLQALVIDDEPQVREFVASVLRDDGWSVSTAGSANEAIAQLTAEDWKLVFCDVVLGGPDGYSVLRHFSEMRPGCRFVLMTGQGSAAGALDATSTGAYDYLLKPFSIADVLRISVEVRAYILAAKRRGGARPKPAGYESDLPLIGIAPKFVECLKMVGRVSRTDLPVVITGESGTGKEVVARAIHLRSKRADRRFVTVNCGAIPTELIESELFGHTRGSFTGADRERVGLWEEATGGTLFLDEITETNPLFQVKLLRALQEGEIRRVGSNRTISVDVRVIAASNRDIEAQVAKGSFRQDLMYRLNAVTIDLPPLRHRAEDISLLAEHFCRRVNPRLSFAAETITCLEGYAWPGNIRELENAILHAASLSDEVVYPEHLPARVRSEIHDPITAEDGSPVTRRVWPTLAEVEERYVRDVLQHTEGNKQAASRILDIDRKTLTRIVNKASGKA